MKKTLLILFGLVLLVGIINITNVSAFLSIGHYKELQNVNNTFGTITIGKHIFLFFGKGEPQANYTLLSNSVSVINGQAIGTATLYKEGVLFSKEKFKGGEVKDAQIFIWVNQTKQVEIPDYKTECSMDYSNSSNGTQVCKQIKVGSHNITQDASYWKPYNKEKLPAGTYKWKLVGKRKPNQAVDWILTSGIGNVDLDQWAWWNSNWNAKREISNLTGNYSILENIPYDSDMNSDFSDLRFINSAEDTELNYTIESYTASTSANIRINNLGASSVMMYYGNSGATTTSSVGNTYLNPSVIYYLDEQDTTGSGSIIDALGSHNGTNNGATNTTGETKTAYDFDGTNDWINITHYGTNYLEGDFSISIWIKSNTLGSEVIIQSPKTADVNDNKVQIGTKNGDTVEGLVYDSGGSAGIILDKTGLSTGTWYHVVMTYDNTAKEGKMYINAGTPVTDTASATRNGDSQILSLGENIQDGGNYYNGTMDEVYIWKKVLTSSEIQALYNQTIPKYVLGSEQSGALTVNITYPQNTTYSENVSTISYTSSSTPQYCWYSRDNGATNSSLFAGGVNLTNAYSVSGSNTWILYCNDSYGHNATDNVTFTLNKLWNNTGYPKSDKDFRVNEFVNVSGKNFTLGGEPYALQGVDSYYLVDYATNHTYNDQGTEINNSRQAVDEILNEAHDLGVNVIRTWANMQGANDTYWNINDSGGHYNLMEVQTPGNYSNKTLEALDWLVYEAGKKDIRLQLVLINNWNEYGGMRWYVEKSPTTDKTYEWINDTSDDNYWKFHDQFYNDTNCMTYYKNFVNMLLNRNNTVTGRLYKDDPTIFAWLLANEPRAKTDPTGSNHLIEDWTRNMTSYIKSIDSKHLVGLGIEGFGDPWEGTSFVDDQNNTGVDFATFELHPDQWDWFAQRSENSTDLAWQIGGVNSTATIDWWTNLTNESWNNRYESGYVPNYNPALARHQYDNWVKQNVEWANEMNMPVLMQEVAMPSSSNDSIKNRFYQQAIHTFYSNGGDGFLYWNLNHDDYYYSTTPAGIMDDGYSFYVSDDPTLKAKSQSVIDAFNFTKHDNNGGSWVRELNNYGYDFITDIGWANDVHILNVTLFLNISNGSSWRSEVLGNTSEIIPNKENTINKQFNNTDTKFYWYTTVYASDGTTLTSPSTFQRIAPDITSTTFTGTIRCLYEEYNMTLNFTATDNGLDTCWYNYNDTDTIVPCSTGVNVIHYFNYEVGKDNLTIYANNTAGTTSSYSLGWNYRLLLNEETYQSSSFEDLPVTFSANFLTNGSDITLANLSYDNQENIVSASNHGSNNFTVSKVITTPSVNSDTNKTFYWKIDQGDFSCSFPERNQTVLNLGIDNCSVNNYTLYNFTIKNEEDLSKLSNTTAKVNLQIYGYGTTNLIQSYNNSFNDTNPFAICLSRNLSGTNQFSHDIEIQYGAEDYATKLYYIQNETINSSNFGHNVSLYTLKSSKSQVFSIIFRDSSFLPVENALVKIYRKYVDEGVYRAVEIPKTDKQGETVAHLELNDVIYKIQVVKYGKILETFNDVLAVCQNPTIQNCEINLNAFSESVSVPDYTESNDFDYTLGYDNSTRVISSIFNIPSGTVQTITLNVTKEDALGTSVCTDSLLSSSGTLSCIVPTSFGNSTIIAKVYKSGNLIGQGSIKLDQEPSQIYGVNLAFLALFVLITLIGAGLSNNPVFTIIFLLVGVTLLFAMNLVKNNGFIGPTATILFLVIAIIIILIKGAKRN